MKYPEDFINKIILGDCLEVMKDIPDKSIDLVLTDPPYGVTGLEWDNDKTEWMNDILRISKKDSAIVVFGTQPFTSKIIYEYRKHFRYCWVWNKKIAGNPLIAKYQPLKIHEDIIVFSKKTHSYYPIMIQGTMRKKGGGKSNLLSMQMSETVNDNYYPTSILEFSNSKRGQHPTEKPVELIKYLVQTYSKENDLILDPFLGSGTTAVACKQLKRNFIGIEISEKYCEIARQRLRQEQLF